MRTIEFGDGAGVPGAPHYSEHAPVTYRGRAALPKGKTELTKTDRNRARRLKKALRRSKTEQQENRLRVEASSNSRKRATLEKRAALRDLQKIRGVTVLPHLKKKMSAGSHSSQSSS